MSRLIVKNLPSYVTPERLKEHFVQKDGPGGTLTDVKVAQKPDGTSRRFGFVGFKTEDEAQKAQKWFDRTFIGMTRINLQVVEGAKDAPKPRPNKKPRLNSAPVDKQPKSESDKKSESKKKTEELTASTPAAKKSKKEAEFEEFMQVMQPRTKKERTWANEDGPIAGPSSQRLDDPPRSATKTDKDENAGEGDEKDDATENIDDLEWMRRRMKEDLGLELEERVFIQDGEDQLSRSDASSPKPESPLSPREETAEAEPSPADNILQSGRLFLRNLSYTCTQSDLEEHFSRFGELAQVHIPLDPVSKSPKGIAFVKFRDPSCAVRAYEELDKTSFQGRLLHILPAAEQKGTGVKGVEEAPGKQSVKKEKEKKRKQTATREFNWSMLYMNTDAVASSIADRMNISKADILNPDADADDKTSAAVKLALAETHIIQETKASLEAEGIDLSAFSTLDSSDRTVRARRSDTCILVKNIPYGTTVEQIRSLFEPHGELSRVVVPPAGTIAVVEFVHPDEAARGFKAVAYRRLGSSIIYLEKAPMGIFSSSKAPSENKSALVPEPIVKPIPESEQDLEMRDGGAQGEEENEAAPGSTLFVKNLAFATAPERLTSVVRHLPGFAFARIQTKPDPKKPIVPGHPPPRLSMGFGFVGFKSPDAAKTALRSMQGLILDGHTLNVKFAGRGTEEDHAAEDSNIKGKVKAKTTKMVVKNVPFEATKKDLRSLFGAHGQLKSVRLPKKFDSRARGFAFLDFATRHEAENAYAALRHTHLLGRHLVLEWAQDGAQDIDALRQKAGVGYGDGAELPGRKRKLNLGENEEVEEE
ncbi:MRD1 [Sanghuangporus sanghuang]